MLTVYGIETQTPYHCEENHHVLQQHLPFTVCAAECEAAEEQSDDEAHTLQVPERSEGKTKEIKQQYLPFTVCAEGCETVEAQSDDEVRTSKMPE